MMLVGLQRANRSGMNINDQIMLYSSVQFKRRILTILIMKFQINLKKYIKMFKIDFFYRHIVKFIVDCVLNFVQFMCHFNIR
jgi:hypothetical protein